jgi:hypothetical protein
MDVDQDVTASDPSSVEWEKRRQNILQLIQTVKQKATTCCSKVIMSGVNSNMIMSGYGDENPDDEGREAVRDYTKSVSRRVNDGEGIVGAGSQ